MPLYWLATLSDAVFAEKIGAHNRKCRQSQHNTGTCTVTQHSHAGRHARRQAVGVWLALDRDNFADTPSPSLLKHLLKGEGGAAE